MNLKRILFCLTAFAAAIATSVPCAAKRPSGSDLRLLYWNIQNGMWSGQDDNYDRFVEWVKEFDADVCVWCEAQSIYRSGTADRMPEADRYLVGNWGELAARYGHKYWYVGGHRDNFPQVITSKYPIENVERIVGEEPDSVVTHGAGWARIVKNGRTVNIVTLHLWPQAYAYRATDVAASRGRARGRPLPPHGDRVYLPAYDRHRSPRRRRALGDAGRQQLVVAARQLVLQMSGGRSAAADAGLRARTYALRRRDRPTASRPVPDDDSFGKAYRFRLLHAGALRLRDARRSGSRRLYRAGARSGRNCRISGTRRITGRSWWTSI